MNKLILTFFIVMTVNLISGQTLIKYKMPDGQIFSEQVFNALKQNFEKSELEVKIIDSTLVDNVLTRVVDIKSKGYFEAKENNEKFDPYEKFKKRKGEFFKISEFSDLNGKKYSVNELIGKPTIINFWFTSCAPCISELPYLLNLKDKFGDNLNYLAITFDSKTKVDSFINKNRFDFKHITDSKKQISDLGIQGYPMTFLLDDKGKIYEIYGGLSDFEFNEIIETLEKKLL